MSVGNIRVTCAICGRGVHGRRLAGPNSRIVTGWHKRSRGELCAGYLAEPAAINGGYGTNEEQETMTMTTGRSITAVACTFRNQGSDVWQKGIMLQSSPPKDGGTVVFDLDGQAVAGDSEIKPQFYQGHVRVDDVARDLDHDALAAPLPDGGGKYAGKNPLSRLRPGEPFFFVRAQDALAAGAVEAYATSLESAAAALARSNPSTEQMQMAAGLIAGSQEVHEIANAILIWQADNQDAVKLPD